MTQTVNDALAALTAAVRAECLETWQSRLKQLLGDVDIDGAQTSYAAPAPARKSRGKATIGGAPDQRVLTYIREHPSSSGEAVRFALNLSKAQWNAIRASLGRKLVMKGRRRGATYTVRGAK